MEWLSTSAAEYEWLHQDMADGQTRRGQFIWGIIFLRRRKKKVSLQLINFVDSLVKDGPEVQNWEKPVL